MHYDFKCFDKVQTTSDWIKFFREFNAMPVTKQVELGNLDCWIEEASQETEKAWCFDYSALYKEGKCNRRFYYAPKSQCKVLRNDYYRNEDGSLYRGKFILVPAWIESRIGA